MLLLSFLSCMQQRPLAGTQGLQTNDPYGNNYNQSQYPPLYDQESQNWMPEFGNGTGPSNPNGNSPFPGNPGNGSGGPPGYPGNGTGGPPGNPGNSGNFPGGNMPSPPQPQQASCSQLARAALAIAKTCESDKKKLSSGCQSYFDKLLKASCNNIEQRLITVILGCAPDIMEEEEDVSRLCLQIFFYYLN